ncbi:unnamed protein product [Paramecium octaurelia]|uniref:Uncharacterized protein n=1 Tax=Paramecium octaurelia TaxID=43137 RepID=A0A8S1S8Z6_PAROT|nr:unnamed protein product [Paramecium octaurelia]
MKQLQNPYLCLIGNQRSLKTTLLQYFTYYKIVDTQLCVYLVCSEEKFLANTSLFGKLIPVYQETLQQMNVKLIKSYSEYLAVLGSFSYLDNNQYDIIIFDDISHFIGTDQKEKKLNLILHLISQIKPRQQLDDFQIIVNLQSDIIGQLIDLINLIRYHNFLICELKLSPKLTIQIVDIIKIMDNYQLQYKTIIMSDISRAINDRL